MPFRLLQHLVRIWEKHREQYFDSRSLPGIVPMVLYHGHMAWRVPRFFSKMMNMPVDLGIQPLDFEYLLIDLSRIPDQLLRDRLELEVSLSLLRHIHDDHFLDFFQHIIGLLAELRTRKTCLEHVEAILRYVYYSRGQDEWEDLVEILHHTDPVIEEVAVTTIAEHHFYKGKAAGHEQGIAQGMAQGLTQGMLSEAHGGSLGAA